MVKNRKKKLTIAIVDTETTMKNEHSHLIYDFAFIIGDIYDEFCEPLEKNYLIKDTLAEPKNFIFSYKKQDGEERIPFGLDSRYKPALERWAKSERYEVNTWDYAYKQFWNYCSRMGVEIIVAYNLNFDLKAIQKTHAQYTDKQFRLPNGTQKLCLMDVCQTFVMNRDFKLWFDSLNSELQKQFITEKGNISYSAEMMYRYIFDDYYYTEQHTALRDCRMEWKLLRYAYRKWEKEINKNFVDNIRGVSWETANKIFSTAEKLRMREKKTRKIKQLELAI